MSDVWVVTHLDYEQTSVWSVHTTPEAATEHVRALYTGTFQRVWDEPRKDADGWYLVGHSGPHQSHFHIARFEVDPLPPSTKGVEQ